jgi:hypothetical protein
LAWYNKSEFSQTASASAVRDPNQTDNPYSTKKKQDQGFGSASLKAVPDPAFHFKADPDPAAHHALEC